MANLVRTPIIAFALFMGTVPFLATGAEAKSTFMAECSAKYKAAKADGSVDAATKWTDFMKNQCKDLKTDAAATDVPAPVDPVVKATKAKAAKATDAAATTAEEPATTPSGSFLKDCSAAWKTMKTNNTVPDGLTWKAFLAGKCVAKPKAAAAVEASATDPTFMEKCATDWKAMKASLTVPEGLTWKAFVKGKCVDKPAAKTVSATKKKPATTDAAVADVSNETFIQKCGTDWKAMKAAGTVPDGLTWKQFVIGKCVARPAGAATTAAATYGKSFMTKCSDDWKAMKANNTVPEGLTWKQFVTAKCVVEGQPAATMVAVKKTKKQAAVNEVAPDEPTAASETSPVKLVDKNGKPFTAGQLAAHARARTCGAKWRAEKAAGTLADGAKWPQYWSTCNAEMKAASQ